MNVTITIYSDLVEPLAQWIATGGTAGGCPEWYGVIQFARTLNCSAMDVEAMFREINPDHPIAGAQEWLNRAVTAQQAEVLAQKIAITRGRIAAAAPKLHLA